MVSLREVTVIPAGTRSVCSWFQRSKTAVCKGTSCASTAFFAFVSDSLIFDAALSIAASATATVGRTAAVVAGPVSSLSRLATLAATAGSAPASASSARASVACSFGVSVAAISRYAGGVPALPLAGVVAGVAAGVGGGLLGGLAPAPLPGLVPLGGLAVRSGVPPVAPLGGVPLGGGGETAGSPVPPVPTVPLTAPVEGTRGAALPGDDGFKGLIGVLPPAPGLGSIGGCDGGEVGEVALGSGFVVAPGRTGGGPPGAPRIGLAAFKGAVAPGFDAGDFPASGDGEVAEGFTPAVPPDTFLDGGPPLPLGPTVFAAVGGGVTVKSTSASTNSCSLSVNSDGGAVGSDVDGTRGACLVGDGLLPGFIGITGGGSPLTPGPVVLAATDGGITTVFAPADPPETVLGGGPPLAAGPVVLAAADGAVAGVTPSRVRSF